MQNRFQTADFFPHEQIVREGGFSLLDEVDTHQPNALVYCQNLHFVQQAIQNPCISTILTTPELAQEVTEKAVIVAKDPRLAYFEIYVKLQQKSLLKPSMNFGVGQNCQIHASAVISKKSFIGNNVKIGANVVIHDHVIVGDDTIIESNVVVGAEGMITIWKADGEPLIVPHAGGVKIGKKCIILSGAVIAKSLYSRFTSVGDYCQIGILSNVGHGAQVGNRTVISGNCVIAGRTVIGDQAWIGASSSISQGLTIGNNVQIKLGSVVVHDLENNAIVSGNFAINHKRNMKRHLELTR